MKKETKEIVALTEKWWVIYKKVISLLVGVAFHLKLISANSQ